MREPLDGRWVDFVYGPDKDGYDVVQHADAREPDDCRRERVHASALDRATRTPSPREEARR